MTNLNYALHACPECRCVWEYEYRHTHISGYHIYTNFPRIGKPVEICPECKNKRSMDVVEIKC